MLYFSIFLEIMEKQVINALKRSSSTNPELSVDLQNETLSLEIEELLKSCLRQLHVIQCQSLKTLLVTMETISNLCAHNANKCVLIIDSITAVYGHSDNPETKKYFPVLVEKLKTLISTYRLVLFVSRTLSFVKDTFADDMTTAGNMRKYYEFMGKVWSSFVNYKLVFSISNRSQPQVFTVRKEYGFDQQSNNSFRITGEGIVYI